MASILDIQMRGKRFVDLTTPAFRTKLVKIANNLGLDASAIATVMMFESSTTMSPSVRNPYSNATGLIQFMPATAKNMGTTVDALAKMSAIDQLDWVEKYFEPWAHRLHTPQDHYLAVFLPSLIGTALNSVAASKGTAIYSQNSGFDTGGKGYFTTGDVVYPITSAYNAAKARPTISVSAVDWQTPVLYVSTVFLFGVLGFGVGKAGNWAVDTIWGGK